MRYHHEDLVRSYIATRQSHVHEDFVVFYKAQLLALEKLFGVELQPRSALGMLFHAVVTRYVNTQDTRSGFLEDTLVTVAINRLSDQGKVIEAAESLANERIEQTQQALFDLLMLLFKAIHQPTREFVTSEDLQVIGFDDTKEPKIYDYYDYM